MTDYRTPQVLDVIVDGRVVFRQHLLGSSDTAQLGMDVHYARIYARILNPDLPGRMPAVFRWVNRFGTVELDGCIPPLPENYAHMVPWVLYRFADREWEQDSA